MQDIVHSNNNMAVYVNSASKYTLIFKINQLPVVHVVIQHETPKSY